ncbi:ankyrin repeat domain-containing protein [bacterium]|nr:ankyrin repeat domain-containing protein [bacterium]
MHSYTFGAPAGQRQLSPNDPAARSAAPADPHVQAGLEQARALARKMLKTLRGLKGEHHEQQHFAALVISRHPRFSSASSEDVIAAAQRGVRLRGGADAAVAQPAAPAGAPVFRLADALLVIAREHGLPSWPKLKAYIIENAPYGPRAAKVIDWAREGEIRRARALLDASPGLSTYHAGLAAMCGEAQWLEQQLRSDPALASRPVGHRNWPPLLYLCFSQLHRPIPQPGDSAVDIAASLPDPYSEAGILECARLLLQHGADANAAYDSEPPWEGSRLSALYGASGHGNFPALTRLLLEAGADPNDGESVYHCAQRNMRDCLELLLAHGAQLSRLDPVHRNTPLYFVLGYREHEAGAALATAGARWLLEHGADPNIRCYEHRSTVLHLVCEKGRSAAVVNMLLAFGADPAVRRSDGATPYMLALRNGSQEACDALEAWAAQKTDDDARAARAALAATPLDLYCGAAMRGGLKTARTLAAQYGPFSLGPEEQLLLVNAAAQGRSEAVSALLALGWDPAFEEGAPIGCGTALHHAAFHGWAATVRAIIAALPPEQLSARLSQRDGMYHGHPLGWCTYASTEFRNPQGDYIATAAALLDAGSPTDDMNPGAEDVARFLQSRGVDL